MEYCEFCIAHNIVSAHLFYILSVDHTSKKMRKNPLIVSVGSGSTESTGSLSSLLDLHRSHLVCFSLYHRSPSGWRGSL